MTDFKQGYSDRLDGLSAKTPASKEYLEGRDKANADSVLMQKRILDMVAIVKERFNS